MFLICVEFGDWLVDMLDVDELYKCFKRYFFEEEFFGFIVVKMLYECDEDEFVMVCVEGLFELFEDVMEDIVEGFCFCDDFCEDV